MFNGGCTVFLAHFDSYINALTENYFMTNIFCLVNSSGVYMFK